MKPATEATSFGSITVAGQRYPHDIIIQLDGSVHKRKKKLSKEIYGTSHTISLAEAEHVYETGAEVLIVGTGQFDQVRLSSEARIFLEGKNLEIRLAATPEAITLWNQAAGKTIGLFHVTC